MKTFTSMVVGSIAAMASACSTSSSAPGQAGSAFLEPVPAASELALAIPGSASGATTAQSVASGTLHATDLPSAPAAAPPDAQFYTTTRGLTDGVDTASGAVLGLVWSIANSDPTSVTAQHAVWGPTAATALSPAVWRFVVNEIGDGEFDYELDGRPKASTSDADYRSVLQGHGYADDRPEHHTGWVSYDADAARAVDSTATGSGQMKVTFDLRAIPATLDVSWQPDGAPSAEIDVTHQAAGAGEVALTTEGKVGSKATAPLEDIVLRARWDATGAGRGDATLGDANLPTVTATECWSSSFARVYYVDSVASQPTSGAPAACAFATPF